MAEWHLRGVSLVPACCAPSQFHHRACSLKIKVRLDVASERRLDLSVWLREGPFILLPSPAWTRSESVGASWREAGMTAG